MIVIAKRSYHFRDVDYKTVTLDNGKEQLEEILKAEHKCQASTAAQEVPDRVKQCDLSKLQSMTKTLVVKAADGCWSNLLLLCGNGTTRACWHSVLMRSSKKRRSICCKWEVKLH